MSLIYISVVHRVHSIPVKKCGTPPHGLFLSCMCTVLPLAVTIKHIQHKSNGNCDCCIGILWNVESCERKVETGDDVHAGSMPFITTNRASPAHRLATFGTATVKYVVSQQSHVKCSWSESSCAACLHAMANYHQYTCHGECCLVIAAIRVDRLW